MIFKKFLSYLLFWKKQPDPTEEEQSSYLKMMHGINKLSILLFIFCICVIIYRILFR
ncbi:MAG: DUF6728 family protein [Bacteroidia bacterium]